MSKALKKLIDINRLREFKNKLVGTDSAYVQTGAVDQTIAGTKTFSKPIAGSVTGSSGSCTGNAATATTATTAESCTGNAATATNATYTNWLRTTSHPDFLFRADWDGAYFWTYVNDPAGNYFAVRVARSDSSGNADTATKLATARTIALSGAATGTATGFDGSGNITIPVTSLDASKLTGTASVSTTGNAATATTATTATNATYANWLRTSSHSDHLFHTEWDEAGYFWTYVTAGDGGYRPVRVARSDSAATAESCTGNADTATKLATARTIALSGAATGTATGFDGSGNITIPVTALSPSAIRAQWYAAYPDGAEAHNSMWGGRDITAAFDAGTVSANIANGTFRDIFPGDYITKQVTISGTTYTVNWVIADCDYWWHKGDQNNGMETHHVVIVPQVPIFNANMNATNTAEGGYAGSEMYRNVIPACATGIVSAFGSSHILTFRDYLTQDLNTSAVSSGITVFTGAPNWNGGWYSQQCNLMSEAMVYDGPHCASSAFDNVMATRQMSAFRLSERLINNRQVWWLRDVVSSASFALVGGYGRADASYASAVLGVRPFALLK